MRIGRMRRAAGAVVMAAFPLAGPAVRSVATTASGGATAEPFVQRIAGADFAQPPTTAQCEQATGLRCYSPGQVQTAYDMSPLYARGMTGRGETIAIVDSFGSPTIAHDLAAFDKGFGLPDPASLVVLAPAGPVPPFDPSNAAMVNWAAETSLDVEYAHAMAPGANILLVETPVNETIGTHGFPEIVTAEDYVIDHNLADVISQSFGAPEQTFPSQQSLLDLRVAYKNAQKHHVTVLAASGDAGASGVANPTGTKFFTQRVVDWPASDPLVTAIGGTQLHLDAAGRRVRADNVWNDTNLFGSPASGGGGQSTVFARPSYQNAVSDVVGPQRGLPDISLSAAADGGALVHMSFGGLPGPGYYLIGGTSWATPLFSGLVAVADQVAGHRLGLLNPALYQLGAAKAEGLPDITIGNNTVSFFQSGSTYTVDGFLARPGYDLASGLGTVDGAKLAPELAKQ